MKYFVFVDESGTSLQDDFFGLGCLIIPQEKIGEYNSLLQKKYDKIYGMVKVKEQELLAQQDEETKKVFLKSRNTPYEMKFKNINQTTIEGYKRLMTQYFKFSDVKFCALIIDRRKYPFPETMSYFDAYLNQLAMLIKNNFDDKDEFVILPDSITVPPKRDYEKEATEKICGYGKKCFGICRIESHSSVFLQMVDCLIGAVIFDQKKGKHPEKQEIVNKIKKKIEKESLSLNFTTHKPNYFSVWNYCPKN